MISRNTTKTVTVDGHGAEIRTRTPQTQSKSANRLAPEIGIVCLCPFMLFLEADGTQGEKLRFVCSQSIPFGIRSARSVCPAYREILLRSSLSCIITPQSTTTVTAESLNCLSFVLTVV